MIVGLTGGIASGKSTVADILRGVGMTVIDADEVARAVVMPDTPALQYIKNEFGDRVIDGSGQLDRNAMAEIVLQDRDAKQRLEAITHPAIRLEIRKRIEAAYGRGERVIFVEAALLVETGSHALYPHLWVVRCPPRQQIKRLMLRKHCTRDEAERWLRSQMPASEKEAFATQLIDNTGSVEDLRREVMSAHAELMGQLRDPD